MQVVIRSKNVPVNADLQQFVEKEAQRLSKATWKLQRIEAFLEVTREQFRVLLKAIRPGKNLVVEERTTDAYLAVAQAVERLQRALRKQREKRLSLRKSARAI